MNSTSLGEWECSLHFPAAHGHSCLLSLIDAASREECPHPSFSYIRSRFLSSATRQVGFHPLAVAQFCCIDNSVELRALVYDFSVPGFVYVTDGPRILKDRPGRFAAYGRGKLPIGIERGMNSESVDLTHCSSPS